MVSPNLSGPASSHSASAYSVPCSLRLQNLQAHCPPLNILVCFSDLERPCGFGRACRLSFDLGCKPCICWREGRKDGSSQCPSPGSHLLPSVQPSRASHSRNLSLHALAPTLGGRSQGSSSALIASGCRKNPCVFLGVIFFLV